MRGTQPIVPSRAAMNRVKDFPSFVCIVARTVRREVCERIHLIKFKKVTFLSPQTASGQPGGL